MRHYMSFLLLMMVLMTGALAQAAPQAATPVPDKPTSIKERVTTVTVQHEGTDSVGARLATRLKESFNSSNLFDLSDKDVPKIRLLVTSSPEFPGRAGLGSVYSVIWVFVQNETLLTYYLANQVGTLSPDEVDSEAAKLVERTDGIAARYGSLFPN